MSISAQLSSYLNQRGAHYEVCAHAHSRCSAQTARTAHIPPGQLAKSVILEDDAGCIMAVVPSDRNVRLGLLARLLDRPLLRLADESRIATLLPDCECGAVPAIGMAWGIETIVDDELDASPVVYVEAGDHERLLRLTRLEFRELTRDARRGRFCGTRLH